MDLNLCLLVQAGVAIKLCQAAALKAAGGGDEDKEARILMLVKERREEEGRKLGVHDMWGKDDDEPAIFSPLPAQGGGTTGGCLPHEVCCIPARGLLSVVPCPKRCASSLLVVSRCASSLLVVCSPRGLACSAQCLIPAGTARFTSELLACVAGAGRRAQRRRYGQAGGRQGAERHASAAGWRRCLRRVQQVGERSPAGDS